METNTHVVSLHIREPSPSSAPFSLILAILIGIAVLLVVVVVWKRRRKEATPPPSPPPGR